MLIVLMTGLITQESNDLIRLLGIHGEWLVYSNVCGLSILICSIQHKKIQEMYLVCLFT